MEMILRKIVSEKKNIPGRTGFKSCQEDLWAQTWIFGLAVVSALSCSIGFQSKLWVWVMPLFLVLADDGKLQQKNII